MRRELTFYPETERTRDLVYAEQSSCDRSLHLLLQDTSNIPYEYLLKAYRAVVTRYLSGLSLRPPEAFVRGIVSQLEQEAVEAGFDLEGVHGAGFHLLLRGAGETYVLTLNEREVLVQDRGELITLPDVSSGAVERVRLPDDETQPELFPQRLRDIMALYRIESSYLQDRDIVLGCREQERGTVLENLLEPVGPSAGEATRKAVRSKFVSRRILAVRFDADGQTAEPLIDSLGRPFGGDGGEGSRRRSLVAGASVVAVIVLIIAFWLSDRGGGSDAGTADQPVVTELPDEAVEAAPPAGEDIEKREQVTLSEAWKTTYDDQVTSSPLLHGDRVVFGCRDGHVYALDKGSGELVWKYAGTGGIGASPAMYNEYVIAADYNGHVFAVDINTGRQMWNRKLPMRVVSSPQVSGDWVVVGCYDGTAYCLAGETGEILWKRKTKDRIRGSCAAAGETFAVPSYDGFLYGLDVSTGDIRWRFDLGGRLEGSAAANPTTVVVGAPDGRVRAVAAGSGEETWSFATGAAVKSSPAIASGMVYVGSNDACVYCINLADGSLMWKYKTGDIVLAKPFVNGGVVYVGSYDGRLYALDAGDGTLLDEFETGGAIYSSPTGDGEHVYFGTNRGDFVCLSNHAKKSS